MIMRIEEDKYDLVKNFLENDIGRNYFILLGLVSKKQVFEAIYGEYRDGKLQALLFKRKSGTLQFYGQEGFNEDKFADLISTMDYNGLIGPKSSCDKFLNRDLFSQVNQGAYIAKLARDEKMEALKKEGIVKNLKIYDLDRVVGLYEGVFENFASREIMEEKIRKNRGRGVYIADKGEIVSVAQTDFETKDSAIIVGVATKKDYRGQGLARECLEKLSSKLLEEGKNIYLQYDNLDAGKIYEKLGFKIIDQVKHYKR